MFTNHGFAAVSNVVTGVETFYDPSYGKMYSTLQEMDDGAIQGFFVDMKEHSGWEVNELAVNLDLDGDGNVSDVDVLRNDVYLFRKNSPARVDIQEKLGENGKRVTY